MVEDKHVIETLGKVRVVIENGEFIRKNINFRIKDFGMCTPQRVIEMDDLVTVGISEILKTNMEKGNIDCVVGACDGAGTLLMTNPRVVQGVGGRVSGLVSTTPIPEVIKNLEEKDCVILNPETAELNQLEGLKIAVTACASKAVSDYADENKPYYYGVKVPIFCASEDGRRFLDIRLEHIGKPLTTDDYPRDKSDAPHKLI